VLSNRVRLALGPARTSHTKHFTMLRRGCSLTDAVRSPC
jgi:hypothetical protein